MTEDNFYALAELRDSYRSRYPVVPLSEELRRLVEMAERALAEDEPQDRA